MANILSNTIGKLKKKNQAMDDALGMLKSKVKPAKKKAVKKVVEAPKSAFADGGNSASDVNDVDYVPLHVRKRREAAAREAK